MWCGGRQGQGQDEEAVDGGKGEEEEQEGESGRSHACWLAGGSCGLSEPVRSLLLLILESDENRDRMRFCQGSVQAVMRSRSESMLERQPALDQWNRKVLGWALRL